MNFQQADPYITNSVRAWIMQAMGKNSTIEAIAPLSGATSSSVYQVTMSHPSNALSLVLRLFTNRNWLHEEPDIARHEADSLKMAQKIPVPTPELIAYDENGEVCGMPAVLMTRLDGKVDLFPDDLHAWIRQCAESLCHIHFLASPHFPWSYSPYYDIGRCGIPQWSNHPKSWQEALDFLKKGRPEASYCFIHRDYHPVNILWQQGHVSGIVDWANACIGPAGIDIGHCRLNLALLYGVEVADLFLEAYLQASGSMFVYHPYWDLNAIFDFGMGPPEVYPGWLHYGVKGLTSALMQERMDEYLLSIFSRMG